MGTGTFKLLILCIFIAVVVSDYPTGHLQPFGHHRPPTITIDEIQQENLPPPEEFYETYVKQSKPVIFRNAVVDSRAYHLWTDEYIRTNFGDLEVRLEGKKEKKDKPPMGEKYLGRDTLRHFVDTYHEDGNIVYVVSDLPSKLYQDVGVIPSFGACGEMSRRIVEMDIWWSGGGSASVIHKDAFNQMNCLLNGTKYWKLIPYDYEKDIYKHPEPEDAYGGFSDINVESDKDIYKHPESEDAFGGFSDINVESVNLIEQPNVQNVEWSNITINAGDCLFLPKSYYHQVNSVGTNNKAVSILFSRFDDRDKLDFSDCTEDTDYKSIRPLTDFNVQWVWHGKGVMVIGNSDLEEGVRAMLLKYVVENENDGREFDVEILEFLLNNSEGSDMQEEVDVAALFNEIDTDGNGVASTGEINTMSIDLIRRVALQMERYEPSNHYEFEYSIVSFEQVWALAKLVASQYKTITKDIWLKYYKRMGGTAPFGEEIFDRLSGDKVEITSADITDEILYNALENWVKYYYESYSSLDGPPSDFSKRHSWYKTGVEELKANNVVRIKSREANKIEESKKKDEL